MLSVGRHPLKVLKVPCSETNAISGQRRSILDPWYTFPSYTAKNLFEFLSMVASPLRMCNLSRRAPVWVANYAHFYQY